MQKDALLESKEAELRVLESSLMERINNETIAKKEMEEAFTVTITNTMNEIKGEVGREVLEGEQAVSELKEVLEVMFNKRIRWKYQNYKKLLENYQ